MAALVARPAIFSPSATFAAFCASLEAPAPDFVDVLQSRPPRWLRSLTTWPPDQAHQHPKPAHCCQPKTKGGNIGHILPFHRKRPWKRIACRVEMLVSWFQWFLGFEVGPVHFADDEAKGPASSSAIRVVWRSMPAAGMGPSHADGRSVESSQNAWYISKQTGGVQVAKFVRGALRQPAPFGKSALDPVTIGRQRLVSRHFLRGFPLLFGQFLGAPKTAFWNAAQMPKSSSAVIRVRAVSF